jgi:acetate kinase
MGTRCGQLDPGVVLYLIEQEGLSTAKEVSDLLYKQSGLLGLSGISSDMRTLEASDAPEAAQAIDYFVFRIRRELGAIAAVLGGLDTLHLHRRHRRAFGADPCPRLRRAWSGWGWSLTRKPMNGMPM